MDIAALSIVMSELKAQTATGIAVTKISMDKNKETGIQMAQMMKNVAVDPNLGSHIDVSV